MVSPEGTQDGNRMPAINPKATAATLHRCTLGQHRMGKHRILAPDSWGTYLRNDFSEPRLLHLPIHRKVLNSLPWDVWFSLIIIFWYSDYLVFVTKLTGVSLTSLDQSLKAIWEAVSWPSSHQKFHQIKHNLEAVHIFQLTNLYFSIKENYNLL